MAANNTQYPNSRKGVNQPERFQNTPGNSLKGTKLGESSSTDDSREDSAKALYPNS